MLLHAWALDDDDEFGTRRSSRTPSKVLSWVAVEAIQRAQTPINANRPVAGMDKPNHLAMKSLSHWAPGGPTGYELRINSPVKGAQPLMD